MDILLKREYDAHSQVFTLILKCIGGYNRQVFEIQYDVINSGEKHELTLIGFWPKNLRALSETLPVAVE